MKKKELIIKNKKFKTKKNSILSNNIKIKKKMTRQARNKSIIGFDSYNFEKIIKK